MMNNEVKLIGRLTKDLPAPDTLEEDKPLRVQLAVNSYIKGEEKTNFIPVVIWGENAKNLCKYQGKGSRLNIRANLKAGKYKKDGKIVYTLDVVAEKIQYLDPKSKNKNIENCSEFGNFGDLSSNGEFGFFNSELGSFGK